MIPLSWKLIGAAVAVAGVLTLAATVHWQYKRAEHWKGRAEVVEATLEAERAARAHEQRIAKEASDGYQAELKRIQADALQPAPVVRLCRRAHASVPEAGAATGSDAAAPPDDAGGDAGDHQEGVDIGPDLMGFAAACEANAAQLQALQGWVRAR